jgi:endonuclease YncB( thermonuclease family)
MQEVTPVRLLICFLAALAVAACAGPSRARERHDHPFVREEPRDTPGLLIGDFALSRVVDGDTIRVVGQEKAIRLLNIDTEETFKSQADKRLFEHGWDEYLRVKRGQSRAPVKMATPLGEDAKEFAKRFFDGAKKVRLERDHPKDMRDRFGRALAYVLVERGGKWVNYNVECVRSGMSPYFHKYGYSRRFHAEFVAAQDEARRAGRGIWNPKLQHYPDYTERLSWWDARADFQRQFDQESAGREDYVDLAQFDAHERVEKLVGREAVVLGIVGDVKNPERGPIRVLVSRRKDGDVPLVFFDKPVLDATGIAKYKGEFVRVKGKVSRFEGRGRTELQIVVNRAEQVTNTPRLPGFVGQPEGGEDEKASEDRSGDDR